MIGRTLTVVVSLVAGGGSSSVQPWWWRWWRWWWWCGRQLKEVAGDGDGAHADTSRVAK